MSDGKRFYFSGKARLSKARDDFSADVLKFTRYGNGGDGDDRFDMKLAVIGNTESAKVARELYGKVAKVTVTIEPADEA